MWHICICNRFFFFFFFFKSSVLGSGFGSFNAPKSTSASDIRTSEQLSGSRHSQRVNQTLVTSSNSSVSKDAGQHPIQNPVPVSSTSVEVKAQTVENGLIATHSKFKKNKPYTTILRINIFNTHPRLYWLILSFFSVEIKLQPEPSPVLSQLAQRQQQSSILPSAEPLGSSQLHAPEVPTPPGLNSVILCHC